MFFILRILALKENIERIYVDAKQKVLAGLVKLLKDMPMDFYKPWFSVFGLVFMVLLEDF